MYVEKVSLEASRYTSTSIWEHHYQCFKQPTLCYTFCKCVIDLKNSDTMPSPIIQSAKHYYVPWVVTILWARAIFMEAKTTRQLHSN